MDRDTETRNLLYREIATENLRREHRNLCRLASASRRAKRRTACGQPDHGNIRAAFARDADRIMHCSAYARYIDKTQVFFLLENDEITHRVLHVQFVSKVGRTIARALRANEDLVESIALGHDIGHAPFGHAGEEFLAEILQEAHVGTFVHNAQSVRVLDALEDDGKGLNLTLQVLDGILGHNGEISQQRLVPASNLTWEALDQNVARCLKEPHADQAVYPSTLEGCIVRVADIISYIGRDIEDAIKVELIKREDLPPGPIAVLGAENRDIINALVLDVINASAGKDWIGFSEPVFAALEAMKKFNYDRIYKAPCILEEKKKLRQIFGQLFAAYMSDLAQGDEGADIFRIFLSGMNDVYRQRTPKERIVADFMAGMTDDFIRNQFVERFVPRSLRHKLRGSKATRPRTNAGV